MRKVSIYYKKILAGTLEHTVENEFIFRYDDTYLESGHPSLSLTLPKNEKTFKSQNLFAFFDGLIPEGWLLKLASEELRLNPLSDRFELLCTLCSDAIGAVHVSKPTHKTQKITEKAKKDHPLPEFDRCLICYADHKGIYHEECMKKVFGSGIHPVVDIDSEVLEKLARTQLNHKLAVPGVQKKLSLEVRKDASKEGRLTVTDLWGNFIFKPKGLAPHLPENEHLCQLLAQSSGIESELSALIPMSDGELGFVARRFDRGPRHEEYHQEDFCQILEKPPHYKYQGSLEQVGKIIKKNTGTPGDNLYRLFELIIFNYLIGNVDFHLKHISLTYESKSGLNTRLSPAYDLLSTDLFIDDNEESALAINGKKNKLKQQDFLELAKSFGIPEKVVLTVFKKFHEQLPVWVKLIDRSFLSKKDQKRFVELIHKKWTIFEG